MNQRSFLTGIAMHGKRLIPKFAKWLAQALALRRVPVRAKHAAELQYWQSCWEAEGHTFKNAHYERIMLAMAGEENAAFLDGKIVADFGCGPRGSLCWAKPARIRIGIDVLADVYSQFNISSHDICYVCATEEAIPLPSDYVDVLFTLNAMDHVSNFEVTCREILRILAPGGQFIGSFNLEEPRTPCEPQRLTEERVKRCLLQHLEVSFSRCAARGPEGDSYRHFFDNSPAPSTGRRLVWVRATKPLPSAHPA